MRHRPIVQQTRPDDDYHVIQRRLGRPTAAWRRPPRPAMMKAAPWRRPRMPGDGPARVLICAPHVHVPTDLRRVLEGHDHEVVGHLLGTPYPGDADACRLVVLDGSGQTQPALELCR